MAFGNNACGQLGLGPDIEERCESEVSTQSLTSARSSGLNPHQNLIQKILACGRVIESTIYDLGPPSYRQTAEPHRGFATVAMPSVVSHVRQRGGDLVPLARVVMAAAGPSPAPGFLAPVAPSALSGVDSSHHTTVLTSSAPYLVPPGYTIRPASLNLICCPIHKSANCRSLALALCDRGGQGDGVGLQFRWPAWCRNDDARRHSA